MRIIDFWFGDEETNGVIPMLFRALRARCFRCGNKKDFWWCLTCRSCMKNSIELMDLCDDIETSWGSAKRKMDKKNEKQD